MRNFNAGNIESSRVFLNAFGFTLGNSKGKQMSILRNNSVVGELSGGLRTRLNARTKDKKNSISLSAVVEPCYINEGPIERINKIDFTLTGVNESATGKMNIATMRDKESCSCRAQMEYLSSDGKIINFTFNKKDSFFCVKVKDGINGETIYMNFLGKGHQGILHTTSIGDKNYLLDSFPSYEEVSLMGFEETSASILLTKKTKNIVGEVVDPDKSKTPFPKKDFYGSSDWEKLRGKMIHARRLMFENDPTAITHVRDIIDQTKLGNVPIARHLVNMCYDRYDERAIEALFGVDRKMAFYQTGVTSLNEAFFGKTNKNGRR